MLACCCPFAEIFGNQAVSIMAEYIKTHPDFVAGVVAWLIVSSDVV
jgi:hypothetical protein